MNEREHSAGADKVEAIARRHSQDGAALARRAEEERAAAAARVSAAQEKQREEADRAAHAAEEEAARRMHAAERKERRAERRQQRRETRTPGFGGLLAAVVSLAGAVLALGAILTVGYFDLDEARGELTDGYRRAAYELAERVEALDTGLAKARVAEGATLQRALTEVLVQCELAERDLESVPVDGVDTAPLAAFFSRTADKSRSMLHKLAAGQELTQSEEAEVEQMYSRVEELREGMQALTEGAAGSGPEVFGAESRFMEGFASLSRIAAEGERPSRSAKPGSQTADARRTEGEQRAAEGGQPSSAESEGSLLASAEALSERQAAERAQSLFSAYGCKDLRIAGKAQRQGVACFTVEFCDGEGRPYTALLTERGGYLAFFDGHEDCSRLRFDRDACVASAQKFLENCGYTGFVPEEEGVLLYTDRVMVKVCRGRGEVTGLDARLYLRNHKERTFAEPSLSEEKVEANAARRMELIGVRKALIPEQGEELLCWEVRGTSGGRLYYAYVDAFTGEAVEIRTACTDGMLH